MPRRSAMIDGGVPYASLFLACAVVAVVGALVLAAAASGSGVVPTGLSGPACSNGVDDDGDQLVDLLDPDCRNDPKRASEAPNVRPRVRALQAKGTSGKILRIRYRAWDADGPVTRERIRVFKKNRKVMEQRTRLHASSQQRVRVAGWKTTKKLKGRFRYCVVAWDANGQRSHSSCSLIRLKPPKPSPPPRPPSPPPSPPVVSPPVSPSCHPSYVGACLDPNASDYDCVGGSGDGPRYTGRVRVVGPDVFRLDGDGDGIGCE